MQGLEGLEGWRCRGNGGIDTQGSSPFSEEKGRRSKGRICGGGALEGKEGTDECKVNF